MLVNRWRPLHCWCCWYFSLDLDKALINILMKIIILASSTTLNMTWTSFWEMRCLIIIFFHHSALFLLPMHHLLTFSFMHLQDTEEIKKLSPAEQRKKIMEIVKKIDANADNLLSAGECASLSICKESKDKQRWWRVTLCCVLPTEEITLWIQHIYRKYALDDAKERFPEFDTNKDGVVTWEEYNMVTHDHLISFDDAAVLEDPEQESLRHVSRLLLSC